jgi:glycosyltransferase involved in cell wall biosynthesis
LKILQVLFSGLGGHGSVAFSLVRGDRARAHQHTMIFYGVEPMAEGYAQTCTDLAATREVIYKRQGLDLQSWRGFIAALKRSAPDVVVLHSTSLIVPAAAYARTADIPLIVVDHLSNQVKQPRDWRFLGLALALADRTVFLTDAFASEVSLRLGRLYPSHRVEVIGNGIDVAAFAPSARTTGTRAGEIRVGMHSRFSQSKDHPTLIRSIARLRAAESRGDRSPVRLSLAGDGETLAATKQLVHTLKVDDRVEFLGMIPESALPPYLASLDIYAQSSLGETMSTGVMQAMAAGLPVVASDVPGLRSMVRERETGILFPVGDDAALACALDELSSNPIERARLGEAAAEQARNDWSHERMFRAYEALLARLHAQTQARRNQERPPGITGQVKRLSRVFRSRV